MKKYICIYCNIVLYVTQTLPLITSYLFLANWSIKVLNTCKIMIVASRVQGNTWDFTSIREKHKKNIVSWLRSTNNDDIKNSVITDLQPSL
jgi:hypothetical protein